MSENSANNKRIAKNTLMLYIRMLITMGVTLYTSRVILVALGVEDYGIYNVVGGVVTMFTMISGSLSSAISRFITFELGKGNQEKLNTIFSTSVIIQLLISVIIVLLVESVGVWFLENKMVIPDDRLDAAKWVLHFSMITLVVNLISIPYNAAIIAHERMSAFAYISIFEAGSKLAIAYFITISPIDKLIFYAILMMSVALMVRIAYGAYCGRYFEECKQIRFIFNKILLKEMFTFAGWTTFGYGSMVLRDQGVNILLNLFGGPAINAAMGVSTQVKGAVMQFSRNFMTALDPQITKSYASGNIDYMMTLIFQGSTLSFYMLLILSFPIIINAEYILTLWLTIVPDHTVLFIQLSLVFGVVQALQYPLITAMLATGNIRNSELSTSFLAIFNLPISYIMLRIGVFPEIVTIIAILISLLDLVVRIIILRSLIKLSAREYVGKVIIRILPVAIVAYIIPYIVEQNLQTSFSSFILVCITSLICSIISIYFIGCNNSERNFIKQKINQFKLKF